MVGLVSPSGTKIICQGTRLRSGRARVDADTLFELGEVSQVFTGLLLAELELEKEISFKDPISLFLPKDWSLPGDDPDAITPLSLITHTSGFPRHVRIPRKGDDPERIRAALGSCTLDKGRNHPVESNFGIGLLGHALETRAKTSFEDLLTQRILRPLKAPHACFEFDPNPEVNQARGHDAEGFGIARAKGPALLPASDGLRASGADLLRLLEFLLAPGKDSKLEPIVSPTLTNQIKNSPELPGEGRGLGWILLTEKGSNLAVQSGAIYGCSSFVGLDLKARTGVFVLSNSIQDVSDLGLHFLDPKRPLARARVRKATTLEKGALKAKEGIFRLSDGRRINLRAIAGGLRMQSDDGKVLDLIPETEDVFFGLTDDIEINFLPAEPGSPPSLSFRNRARTQKGTGQGRQEKTPKKD